MSVLTVHHYLDLASSFIDKISNSDSSYYFFIGKPTPWTNDDGGYNDDNVQDADMSIAQQETSVYRDIVFGKRIESEDVMRMSIRHDWIANTVYAKYMQNDGDLMDQNFYVMTDNLDIYKCIDNNYGNPSTIKPAIRKTSGTFSTTDGYVWKYMYTIPTDIASKFMNDDFIPVVISDNVVSNAIAGTIDSIDLSSFGENYRAYYDGSIQNSVNNYVVVLDANASPYNNFYVGSSMYLKAGFGAGQIRRITEYDGLNKTVRLESPFDTYATISVSDVGGDLNVGDILTQNVDSVSLYYTNGVFSVGDTVMQSDTGSIATIVSANSTNLKLIRSVDTPFDLRYPIFNTSQDHTLKAGFITAQPFANSVLMSNTAAFTNGEVIWQSNGSANVALGRLLTFDSSNTVAAVLNPISDVDAGSDFIAIYNNKFVDGMQVTYTANVGNTAIFGLSNNGVYYVAYANTTGIKLISNLGNTTAINVATSLAKTFNANTGVSSNFISIPTNVFTNGSMLVYGVSNGNTALSGLTNGTTYYAVYANSSGLALANSINGSNVSITPSSISENGHSLTFTIPPQTGHILKYVPYTLILTQVSGIFTNSYQIKGATSNANAVIASVSNNSDGLAYFYSTNTAQTQFVNSYSVGSYIKVGDANTNIRRVLSVNSTCVVVDYPLSNIAIANTHYSVKYASELESYIMTAANGVIVNTNLSSIKVNISNSTMFGMSFSLGERVNLINANNVYQGTYGVVSYSNSTMIVISDVNGSGFVSGFYVYGESSHQKSYINTIIGYPTITAYAPTGTFVSGQQVFARSAANVSSISGYANIISWYTVPNQLTEYSISPTITITGDGIGALAYTIVDTSPDKNLPLKRIEVINPGSGYSYASISITSNNAYGQGASALPSISPIDGHGSDAYSELGARYVSIAKTIANGSLEGYKFPTFGGYRRVGVIDTPLYSDVYVEIDNLDRASLAIANGSANGFTVGEIVYQSNTHAAGIVVYSNDTFIELKSVLNHFSANGYYANGVAANDQIMGLNSLTTAHVTDYDLNSFKITTNNEILYKQQYDKPVAIIKTIVSNNVMRLTNVSGKIDVGDVVYSPATNAYSNIVSITETAVSNDISEIFGTTFNQSLRIPITSSTGSFNLFERIVQGNNTASGTIFGGSVTVPNNVTGSIGNDIDVSYSNGSGTFIIGGVISNQSNTAEAIVVSSNSTYIRLTGVSGNFSNGDVINNTIGASAVITGSYPVLILCDVNGFFDSGILSGNLVGQDSGHYARCDISDVIVYPDIVKNSGKVSYLENVQPFDLSNTSQEIINVIVKF
jgi:hypothetical protein